MKKTQRSSLFFPDYIADSIINIDTRELKKIGITHVVFDLDNTLVLKHTSNLTKEFIDHLKTLQKSGFKIIIGSNTRRDILFVTDLPNIYAVRSKLLSFKPLPSFYTRIAKESGTDANHIAMVGDHVINDIIGSNLAGLTSILITPLSQHIAGWRQRYIRLALR